MKTITCTTLEELKAVRNALGPGVLFRGQVKEYLRENGLPNIITSFQRNGCIPPRMVKWWHYSRQILSRHMSGFNPTSDAGTDQAILQHYGWRSFFIDATTDFNVACWFASHKFHSEKSMELIEDCFEDPVFVLREFAKYEPTDGVGCVYVMSRKALRAQALDVVDLQEIATRDGRPRYVAQSGFMVGPLRSHLPDECLQARILAPASILRELCVDEGGLRTDILFPTQAEDPILAELLSLPWSKIYIDSDNDAVGIDFFQRGLPLPEYHVRSIRRSDPGTAFYRRFWTFDFPRENTPWENTSYYLTDEAIFHGIHSDVVKFPKIMKLLESSSSIVVEIDGLTNGKGEYGKGIYIEKQDDGQVFLTELRMKHFGARPAGFGITRGRYFSVDEEAIWHPVSHADECDCGNDFHHNHHLIVASHFEEVLSLSKFQQVRERVFSMKNVNWLSDMKSIESMRKYIE